MRNALTAVLGALGMTLLVGGFLAVLTGIFQVEERVVSRLGPLDGVWDPAQIRFFGAITASLGSGLFTFAMLIRRPSEGRDLR